MADDPRKQPPAELEIALRLNARLALKTLLTDILMVVWAAGGLVASVIVALIFPTRLDVLAVAVLGVAWCCHVGWVWTRRLRKKVRVLNSGIVTLRLTDLDIRVRNLFGHLDGAVLAWADCAAVVVSKAPGDPSAPAKVSRYVQFVPVDEGRIVGRPTESDSRPDLLGLTPIQSLTAWLELAGQRPGADEVVAWVKARRPGVRLLGA